MISSLSRDSLQFNSDEPSYLLLGKFVFSNECRKTGKTKVITLTNHNRNKTQNHQHKSKQIQVISVKIITDMYAFFTDWVNFVESLSHLAVKNLNGLKFD